jgi:histidinol-phosphate/aromatic aminotransferase/cobyric acid decarboxylase-like protein
MLALKRPQPRAGVPEIEPYMPGGNATTRGATVFKLSSNETPLGPSLNAVCAYHETAKHLAVYPDGSGSVGGRAKRKPSIVVRKRVKRSRLINDLCGTWRDLF